MNERIRELAEQAGYKPLGTFGDELMEIYNKKFAELIVRDCLRQIYSKTLMATPEHKWTSEQTAYNEAIFAAYGQVKTHFGIE